MNLCVFYDILTIIIKMDFVSWRVNFGYTRTFKE